MARQRIVAASRKLLTKRADPCISMGTVLGVEVFVQSSFALPIKADKAKKGQKEDRAGFITPFWAVPHTGVGANMDVVYHDEHVGTGLGRMVFKIPVLRNTKELHVGDCLACTDYSPAKKRARVGDA